MQNKTINELTSLENPRLTDTLPIWDGTEGKTKKVSLAKIPANVITLVDSLPESPNILDRVYRYNNKYYVGNESAQTLTELASKADIPTVVDTVADGNMNPVTSNAVYDALAGNIIVEEVSIAMNHSSTSPFTEGTQSVAKTGYTAIGVAGHGHLGAAGNTLYKSFVSYNRYYFGITGPGSNTNVPIYIIYKKN